MAQPSLEAVLKKLRTVQLADKHPASSPQTKAAWSALGKATADWIDAVRADPRGSYDLGLTGLAAIVATLPEPPRMTLADQLGLDAILLAPRKAIEAPKEAPDA